MTEADVERILCEAPDSDQEPDSEMNHEDLKRWREEMGALHNLDRPISQAEGAAALGISESAFKQYELPFRRGLRTPMKIPNILALACAAVLAGLRPYGLRGRYVPIEFRRGLWDTLARKAIEVIEEAGEPMSTRELLTSLQARGVEIGGADPFNTLSRALSQADELEWTGGRRASVWRIKG